MASTAILGMETHPSVYASAAAMPQQAAPAARELGTIKAIKGNVITLTTDAGADIDVLWVPAGPAHSQNAEVLQARLHALVHNYSLNSNNFIDALAQVAGEFQIPMGVAWVDTPQARAKLSLSWKDATVQEVVEAIAGTQPGYEVRMRNGVIHVFSPGSVPDGQNFLNLKIAAFDVHDQPVETASRKLRDLVKLIVSPPPPSQSGFIGGVAGSGASNVDDARISLRMENSSVETVLDALALSSARRIWIVTFSDDSTLTPTGFRRTLTLWNSFSVPDSEQPIWDMLHWGERIPVGVLGEK